MILHRLHVGILPKQIATDLNLSYHTVVEHIARAMHSLQAHSRIRLLNAAICHGFIPLDPNVTAAVDRGGPFP